MKIYFVIPAFNEAQNVPSLLRSIQGKMDVLGLPFQIILVDDGSSDGTAEAALTSDAPVIVLRQSNQGPGAAFHNGFRTALMLADDEDRIVSLEADNTSDLSILPALLALIDQRHDVALASVYAPGGEVVGASALRKVLSWGANLLLMSALGTRQIHTYSSFFRTYRPAILRAALDAYDEDLITEAGFVCMVELLIKLLFVNARIAEVPMVLDSRMRIGASKMKIARTIRGYGQVLWRFWRGDYQPEPGLIELPVRSTTLGHRP